MKSYTEIVLSIPNREQPRPPKKDQLQKMFEKLQKEPLVVYTKERKSTVIIEGRFNQTEILDSCGHKPLSWRVFLEKEMSGMAFQPSEGEKIVIT